MERNTVQRRAIHKVLEQTGRPMGPPEIYEAAREHAPGLGIATVYRTIKRLLDDGFLSQVELPGEAPRYEMAGKGHHHHFRCSELQARCSISRAARERSSRSCRAGSVSRGTSCISSVAARIAASTDAVTSPRASLAARVHRRREANAPARCRRSAERRSA